MVYYRRIGIVLFILAFLSVCIWYTGKSVSDNKSKELTYDQKKNVTTSQELDKSSEIKNLEFRVELLEKALAPTTPDEVVQKWAEGIKTRNGALQYAMFSPELKEQELSSFEKLGGWITGQSSPWVESYDISKGTQKAQETFEYIIKFTWATTDGKSLKINNVFVKRYETNWYIYDIQNEDGHTLIPYT